MRREALLAHGLKPIRALWGVKRERFHLAPNGCSVSTRTDREEAMGRRFMSWSVGAVALAALLAGPAKAETVEQFYAGKNLNLLIPSTTGGINDLSSRLVARHLGRFIPGHPNVTPQNFPGTAGVIMANRLYNTVEKSGLSIAFIDRAAPQLAVQGDPNVKFDPLKFNWLGSLSSYENDAYLMVISSKSPVKSVEDLRQGKPATIELAAMTPGTTNFIFAYIAKDVLKLNIRITRGYTGAAPMFLAIQSGEVDGQVVGFNAMKAGNGALWTGGKLRALIQFGRSTRSKDLPDVPTGRELAPDADARALIEFAELPFFMALPFAAPPGAPEDRVKALQDAFMAMTKDPEYQADARRLHVEMSPVDGDAIRKLLERAAASPKAVITAYNKLLSQ
jgi:tripartite-type tricarboxylate transporter receptor subunit TctC